MGGLQPHPDYILCQPTTTAIEAQSNSTNVWYVVSHSVNCNNIRVFNVILYVPYSTLPKHQCVHKFFYWDKRIIIQKLFPEIVQCWGLTKKFKCQPLSLIESYLFVKVFIIQFRVRISKEKTLNCFIFWKSTSL